MTLFEQIEECRAFLSPCGAYRYNLKRIWDRSLPRICWVMLNPSTADAMQDDPTIRRVRNFSKAWGYGGFTVYNLFALRATDPKELLTHPDPVGEATDDLLVSYVTATRYHRVVAAWGASVPFYRDREVLRLLSKVKWYCLGTTKSGMPRHPLYCKSDCQPVRYRRT